MKSETITTSAWQQQLAKVENLRVQMEKAPLGASNEDEIVDRYADARNNLQQSPSPDLLAAAWKASMLLIQARDGGIVPADVESLAADLKRLAAA